MKHPIAYVALIFFLANSNPTLAKTPDRPGRLTISPAEKSQDKSEILHAVNTVYEFKSRDYVCLWNGKRKKGDFVSKFKPYFSDRIISEFFLGHEKCASVASARYGFSPLDNEDDWGDTDYPLVQISSPEIYSEGKAIVEVRFWTKLDRSKKPTDQDHGGTIVYLEKQRSVWKISNFESVSLLGGNGFYSLLDDYPSIADPAWKDADYKNSLAHPTHR